MFWAERQLRTLPSLPPKPRGPGPACKDESAVHVSAGVLMLPLPGQTGTERLLDGRGHGSCRRYRSDRNEEDFCPLTVYNPVQGSANCFMKRLNNKYLELCGPYSLSNDSAPLPL